MWRMRINMQKLSVRGVTLGAAVLLGAGMVAGCSSSSDDASDETGGEETSQVLPPVIVEPGQTEATAKVGDRHCCRRGARDHHLDITQMSWRSIRLARTETRSSIREPRRLLPGTRRSR